MKNVFLSLTITLGLIFATSCSDLTTSPAEPREMKVQSNLDSSYFNFAPIKERPNKDTTKKDTAERKRDTVKKENPSIFNDLIIRLQLTPSQMEIVKKMLAEHRSCTENCVKALKDAEREIQTRARNQESEIKKLFESGKITREQARRRLEELKKKTNEDLKNLPIRKSVQECIKSCDSSFINQLERILSIDQKPILKKWLESRAKRGQSDKKDTVTVGKRG